MAGKQLHLALDRSAVSAFKTFGSTKISFIAINTHYILLEISTMGSAKFKKCMQATGI